MTKINVLSFDMDGCLFYDVRRTQNNELIRANTALIKIISRDIDKTGYDAVTVYVGSLRQSKELDDINGRAQRPEGTQKFWKNYQTGSCFPAIKTITTALSASITSSPSVTLDPFLLADAYGEKADGETFNHAQENKKQRSNTPAFSECFADESKLNILYAQMHRAASKNPQATITYNFYDDREDILSSLQAFFLENTDLMPANLTLCLYQYNGKRITNYVPIQGKGPIDHHYKQTIRQMTVDTDLCYPKITSQPYDQKKHRKDPRGSTTLINRFTKHKERLKRFKENRNQKLNVIDVPSEEITPSLRPYLETAL